MGLFGSRKNKDFIDLTDKYNKQLEKARETSQKSQATQENSFSIFGGANPAASDSQEEQTEYINISGSNDERRRRLAKRFLDMTNKIEEMSNQIYHLQQRIEVLERKMSVGNFG